MTRTVAVMLGFALALAASAARVARADDGCEPPSSSSSDSGSSSSDAGSSSSGGSWGDWSNDDDYDSGGGSSGGGSSSSSRNVGCTDDTDITGFEECTRFGREWDAVWPAIRLELGPSFRRLTLDGVTFGGTSYHDGNPHRFVLNPSDLEDSTVVTGGFNFRATIALGRYFLTGVEVDASFGGTPQGEVHLGDRSLIADDVSAITGGVVLGVALPVGPLRFRGEIMGGGQGVGVTATSILGDCVSETHDLVGRWALEARIGVELFIGPWFSVDVWGGADVLNAGSLSGGLRLNVHARSYDAVR